MITWKMGVVKKFVNVYKIDTSITFSNVYIQIYA